MELIKEMKPTKRTLFARQCKSYQFIRFVSLNLRILKIALFPPHQKH
ncbi:hypothetical protein [Calidifontibacillus oryziterrae]|nr:hypothetical protein [Calidifontibacillus oryziterrae]